MRLGMMCLTGALLGLMTYWMKHSSEGEVAVADLLDGKGEPVGHATFTPLMKGVRIQVTLFHLQPGLHSMHIQMGGEGHRPAFKSSGAHFNPFGKRHGAQNKDGPHAGDLPNFEVGDDGTAQVEVTAFHIMLSPGKNSILPSGKTCLVIHEKPDDEVSDPTGNAGSQLACGVIQKP